MPTVRTAQGFNINYEVHGNPAGNQTIIFAHGNGNCLEDWKNLGYIEKLVSQLPTTRFVLMDALGYGKSDKPKDSIHYTPERRAEDIIVVLNYLKIQKAHFLGSSVGGSVGFVLADLYPEYFSSFMIGSAHPYGHTQPIGCNIFDETFRTQIKTIGIQGFVMDLESRFLGRMFHDAVRPQYLQNDPDAIIAANTPLWPDRSTSLSKITVPVLLFAGELDPISTFQNTIAENIKISEVVILPNTDHCDAYWSSEKVVPVVVNFIKKNFPFGNL